MTPLHEKKQRPPPPFSNNEWDCPVPERMRTTADFTRSLFTALAYVPPAGKEPLTPFLSHLIGLIQARGPLTVARYMREVLTNPRWGYYVVTQLFLLIS